MFEFKFTENSLGDLQQLRKADQTRILAAIEIHLKSQPIRVTKNRKRLRPNSLATFELRVGDFRVFYDVDETARIVSIRAVGWKVHNKLYFRGEEFNL